MSYLGELRNNVRPILAAGLGTSTSLPLFAYTNSVFAPHLVEEFGWSRAQFALIGLTMFATLLVLPAIGRFTDTIGVRKVALVGTLLVPLGFVAYSFQQGSFAYFAIVFTLVLMLGSMTSPLVYTRLVAENFDRATGLALTIVNCMPAVVAMALIPVLNWTIETFGWRVSYLGLALYVFVGGLVALALIPKAAHSSIRTVSAEHAPTALTEREPESSAKQDYQTILSSRVFWIITISLFLCLLMTPLHTSQMNLMLIDNGISLQTAAFVVSIYAAGTIVGRIACGLALDRFPTPIVSAVSMVLPAIGLFLLATDYNTVVVIGFAMFLVGLTVGAEADLMPYLVARYFKLRVYGSTSSLIACVNFLASGIGSVMISVTLDLTDSFSLFLFIVSGTVALGSLLFLFMPMSRKFEKIG